MPTELNEFVIPVRVNFTGKPSEPFNRDVTEASIKRIVRYLEDFFANPQFTGAKIAQATITNANIADATIESAKIANLSVDKLTSGELRAEVVVSGKLATALEGQRVEVDEGGIRLIDADDVIRVSLPVEGEALFSGGIEATSLEVTGEATFHGDTGFAQGSVATLAEGGVSDPVSAPAAAVFYPETPLSSIDLKWGLTWDATSSRWLTALPEAGAVATIATNGTVARFNASGSLTIGSGPVALQVFRAPYGMARVGSDVFVLCRAWMDDSKITLQRRDATTFALEAEWNVTASFANFGSFPRQSIGGLAYDGSHLCTLYHRRNAAGVNLSRIVKLTTGGGDGGTVSMANEPSGDRQIAVGLAIVSSKFWALFTHQDTDASRVWVNTTAGSSSSGDDFDVPATRRGLGHDGSNFWTVAPSVLTQHSNWIPAQANLHLAYAWHDNGGGTETVASPSARITPVRRASVRVSTPAIPAGADRIAVYALESSSASAPAPGAMKRQGEATSPTLTLAAYNGAGAADLTSSTLTGGGTPAELVAAATDGWELRGDGTVILPRLDADPAVIDGSVYYNTDTEKFRGCAAGAWTDLH